MENMSRISVLILSILFFNLGCKSQKLNSNLLGNVYSFEGKCKRWTNTYINGIRIDEVSKDSLFLRIAFGKESLYTISMIYDQNSNTFNSKTTIPFYPKEGHYRSKLNMSIKGNSVLLSFSDKEKKTCKKKYLFTYKATIIKERVRNVYYAEDGFKLCKE